MSINFSAGNILVVNQSYVLNSIAQIIPTPSVVETLGYLDNTTCTVITVGNTDTASYIVVLPFSSTNQLYNNGNGATLYFSSDDQLNNSFELSTAFIGTQSSIRCLNSSGSTILKNKLVRSVSFDVTNRIPVIALSSGAASSSAWVLGITDEDIPNGSIGSVLIEGSQQGLNTNGFALGALVFISDTPGEISPAAGTVSNSFARVISVGAAGAISLGVLTAGSGGGGGGIQGATGILGNTGVQGTTGIQGLGLTGLIGFTGLIGSTGLLGPTGIQGLTGLSLAGGTGISGMTGLIGSTGIQGLTGLSLAGSTGITGVTGLSGSTGVQGNTGISGLGSTGLIGATGLGGSASSLSAVLAVGNTTGANNISVNTGQSIVGPAELTFTATTAGVSLNSSTMRVELESTGELLIGSGAAPSGVSAGSVAWSTTLGAINHIIGPSDQTLIAKSPDNTTGAGSRPAMIKTGDVSGGASNSGLLTLQSGDSTSGGTGNISLKSGSVSVGNGNSGSINIVTGSPNGTGNTSGSITLSTTNANGAAGSIFLTAGLSATTAGNISLTTGDGTSGAVDGGSLNFVTGSSSGLGSTGDGGSINTTAGNGGSSSGNGGEINSTTGSATTEGDGGNYNITGGNGVGTDRNGASLTLRTGLGTGSGSESFIVKSGLSLSSGTTAHTIGDRLYVSGKRLALTNNTTTTFATMAVASNTMISCTVNYTSRASDGTDFQVETGWFMVTAVNKAGTITATASPTKYGNQQDVSAGTLTVTPSVTTGSSLVNIRINNNSSLTTTTNDIAYTIVTNSTTTIIPQ